MVLSSCLEHCESSPVHLMNAAWSARWEATDFWTKPTDLKLNKALDENSSLSYGASPAIWDHTVLPATRHKWTRPALTPASKLVLDLPTQEGWKAELT